MQALVTINSARMKINAWTNAKNWSINDCDKGFVCNPSDCECECDKSCDIGEYLDYSNCKCRNKLIDKLIEYCTENIDEVKITVIIQDENKYRSGTLYIVLFWIFFIFSVINIGIGIYFTCCYKYKSHSKKNLKMMALIKQQFIKLINQTI